MEQKQVPTIVFGKQELIQKKLIMQFLVQNNVNFSAVQNVYKDYEAVIKINNINPEDREKLSTLQTGRDSLLSGRSPNSSRYNRVMDNSPLGIKSDLKSSPLSMQGIERTLNRFIRKDLSPCKSPNRTPKSKIMKSVSPIRQNKTPESSIKKSANPSNVSNTKNKFHENDEISVSPIKKNIVRSVTPNSHVRNKSTYSEVPVPQDQRLTYEEQLYIERLCDECLKNVRFADEREIGKVRSKLKAEITSDFHKKGRYNKNRNMSISNDKIHQKKLDNEYRSPINRLLIKESNNLQDKESNGSSAENYYSFSHASKQQNDSKDQNFYKGSQNFDSYENIFLEKKTNKHERSEKEILETPSLGEDYSEGSYPVSFRLSDTSRYNQDYIPIHENINPLQHISEVECLINSEDIPKQINKTFKSKSSLSSINSKGRVGPDQSKENLNKSPHYFDENSHYMDSNQELQVISERVESEDKVLNSERLMKLVKKENFFCNLVSKSVHAFKNQSSKVGLNDLEKEVSSNSDASVTFKSSKLKDLMAKKGSMVNVDSQTTLADKHTPQMSRIGSNIQSRSALLSNCSIEDKHEINMKNDSLTSLDSRSEHFQNRNFSKPPIENRNLTQKAGNGYSIGNALQVESAIVPEKNNLFEMGNRMNTLGSFDGRKYLSSEESCPTLGIEEYKNMNGHFNSFVKDQVKHIINGFDSIESENRSTEILKKQNSNLEEKEFAIYEKVSKDNKKGSSLGTLRENPAKHQKFFMSSEDIVKGSESRDKQVSGFNKGKLGLKDKDMVNQDENLAYKDSRMAALAKLKEVENTRKKNTGKREEPPQRSFSPFVRMQKI